MKLTPLYLLLVLMLFLSTHLAGQPDTAKINSLYRQSEIAEDKWQYDEARRLTGQLRQLLVGKDSFSMAKLIEVCQLESAMLYQEDRYDESEAVIRESLTIARANFPRHSVEQAWAYYNVSWANQQAFDLEEWTAYLDTARALFAEVLGSDDCGHGNIWQDRARMNYFTFGSPDTTLAYARRAEHIYQTCDGGREREDHLYDLQKVFYDVHLSLRQFDSADYYLRRQMDYAARQSGIRWDIQHAWQQLSQAHLYRLNGQYEKAIAHYQLAKAMYEQIPDKDTLPLMNSALYTAWCMNAIGQNTEAIAMYNQLSHDAAKYSKVTWDLAGLIYQGAALAYETAGMHDSTVYAARLSLDAFSHMLHANSAKLIPLYILYGNALSHTRKHVKADSSLQYAHQLAVTIYGKQHPLSLQINMDRGNVAIRRGHLTVGKMILDSIAALPNLEDYPELAYQHAVASAELLIAQNKNKKLSIASRKELISLLQTAMTRLRDVRNRYVVEETRARSVTHAIASLHAIMPSLFHYHSLDPDEDLYAVMLQISETHRGLILSEAIGQSEAYALAGVPKQLQHREKSIKSSLSQIRKKIDQEYARSMPKKDHISRLLEQHIAYQAQLDSLVDVFQKSYPDYYRARFAHHELDLNQVQNILSADEVLVEYLILGDDIYTFVITPSTKEIFRSKRAKQVNHYVTAFLEMMADRTATPDREEKFDSIGYALYQELVQPYVTRLEGAGSLIFIPDRFLHYYPFEVLRTMSPDNSARLSRSALIARYQVQYQASIPLWLEQTENKERPVKHMLTVSPSFMYADVALTSRDMLSPLEHAKDEGRSVYDTWGGRWLHGEKASKANFLKYARQCDMLHLATHAKADDRSGLFSWLAFSPSTKDSMLFLDEIYAMDLKARMVVLSGCETGIGPLQSGEGLISLSRAFSYAGAESIITSLWPVNDASTAQIMASFYEHLRHGKSKDQALQLAKLDYLEKITDPAQADPYYWAGFVAMGDMTPLSIAESKSSRWLIIAAAIVCVILMTFAMRLFQKVI